MTEASGLWVSQGVQRGGQHSSWRGNGGNSGGRGPSCGSFSLKKSNVTPESEQVVMLFAEMAEDYRDQVEEKTKAPWPGSDSGPTPGSHAGLPRCRWPHGAAVTSGAPGWSGGRAVLTLAYL